MIRCMIAHEGSMLLTETQLNLKYNLKSLTEENFNKNLTKQINRNRLLPLFERKKPTSQSFVWVYEKLKYYVTCLKSFKSKSSVTLN